LENRGYDFSIFTDKPVVSYVTSISHAKVVLGRNPDASNEFVVEFGNIFNLKETVPTDAS